MPFIHPDYPTSFTSWGAVMVVEGDPQQTALVKAFIGVLCVLQMRLMKPFIDWTYKQIVDALAFGPDNGPVALVDFDRVRRAAIEHPSALLGLGGQIIDHAPANPGAPVIMGVPKPTGKIPEGAISVELGSHRDDDQWALVQAERLFKYAGYEPEVYPEGFVRLARMLVSIDWQHDADAPGKFMRTTKQLDDLLKQWFGVSIAGLDHVRVEARAVQIPLARQLINRVLKAETTREFLKDYFPRVYGRLADGWSQTTIVQALIEFCEHEGRFPRLFLLFSEMNRDAWVDFKDLVYKK